MKYANLMQTFRLKNLELRNRIFMAPMLSRLCDPDGIVSQKLIDYYTERAKGRTGLIIVEYCYIDEKESKANQGQLGAYSDQLIAGLGDLAEAIQECSVVISQYGFPEACGTIGVIGPTRMSYSKAISAVDYLSSVLTRLMNTLYKGEPGE